MRSAALVVLGCLGILAVGWLIWVIGNTPRPGLPQVVGIMLTVVALATAPWVALVHRRIGTDLEARRVFGVVVTVAVLFASGGIATALMLFTDPDIAAVVAMMSIAAAGVLALVGAVLFPWVFLLTRVVTRERAARVRAEERAEVAAHLHDSVLQSLTLIQKRAGDVEVRRLARSTERELRAWLYGAPSVSADDFVAAITKVAEDVEDRFAVVVELITVGTCPLDVRSRAIVGAVREALTNAAKHADVERVSVFTEVADTELFALVRDRGRGFDVSVQNGRRGVADSIEARVHQHGGMAAIRSASGSGTEVELRMPLGSGQ